MRFIITLGFIAFLSGCADSHQLVRVGEGLSTSLEETDNIYISIPKDGKYGDKNYIGSGISTSQLILIAFSKFSNKVNTGQKYQSFEKALSHARTNNYNYLVFPIILEWEDRATEWSGIPDRASIKISLIETESGDSMESAIITGKSGIATFGGDHPQDLLALPVEEYVTTLF